MNNDAPRSHADCDHERTPAARAACRKARKAAAAERVEARASLIKALGGDMQYDRWVFKAASRFGKVRTSDIDEAADAVLDYFLPSGDDDKDARRRANGYTITTSPHTMRSIILRSFS